MINYDNTLLLVRSIEKVGYSGRGGKGLVKKVTKNDKDGRGVAK